jgi:hypothetical protein
MTLTACVMVFTGCNIMGPLAYYLRPPQIQKAEFEFPTGSRVAVLFDAAQPAYEAPVFNQALFDKLRGYFAKYKSEADLTPLGEVLRLQRQDRDAFATWSIQRIGRELAADYVLHLKIQSLTLRETPEHPLVSPSVLMRAKVIATAHPASDARVWPEADEGRAIDCTRQATEYAGAEKADLELTKLGRDAAYFVMMPFFDVDMEEATPVER